MRAACALALLAGMANGLAWLPVGFAPAAPLFAFFFLRALRRLTTGREALLVGLCFGAARYMVAGHFILSLVRFSNLAVLVFLMYVAFILPFAMLEAWGALALERRTGIARGLWAGLVFTLLEWVRTLGDLSLPADLVAHDFAPHPAWLGWTPWLGPFAVTLLIFAAGALLDLAWERRRTAGRAALLAASALVVWLLPVATSALAREASAAEGIELRVGLVQPAVGVHDKLDRGRWPSTWGRLRELSIAAADGNDLVIWPENARPGAVVWHAGRPFADPRVQALSREIGKPILYGCQIARVEGERIALFNGAALVHPDNSAAQWYGKQRLLPFVEGVPFAPLLGWDPSRRASREGDQSYLRLLGNFTPGTEPTLFRVGPARIGVLICYEGSYPQLARRYRREGANMLAVLTDDAWWGNTLFPRWHATMVATRALETGMPVVRAANDGISSHTDARGALRERSRHGVATVQHVRVELDTTGPAPYVDAGDLVIGAGWGVLALALGAAFIRGRRTGRPRGA